jgi:hypothetical protein
VRVAPLLAVAVAVVVTVAGCKRRDPAAPASNVDPAAAETAAPRGPAVLVDVRVRDRGTEPGAALGSTIDAAVVANRAARALVAASGIVDATQPDGGVALPGARRYRLRLDVSAVSQALPTGVIKHQQRAAIDARLEPVDAPPGALRFDDAAVAERTVEDTPSGKGKTLTDLAARLAEDLMKQLGGRVRLAVADDAALVAAIGGSDEALRDEAIRLAGERRARDAVPALLGLLKSEDDGLRDRALGALATIGDVRAVRPITESVRFRDTRELPKVIDAMSRIGGDEAQAWLELVASGHESAEIRELAQKALGHLERRKQAAK